MASLIISKLVFNDEFCLLQTDAIFVYLIPIKNLKKWTWKFLFDKIYYSSITVSSLWPQQFPIGTCITSRNLHDSCDIYRFNILVWNSKCIIVFDFGFVTFLAFFGCEPVRSWWGYLTTWEIIWNIFFKSFLLWEIVKEHDRFVASICDLMRCIARDNNKGGIIVSIDFDGLVTNLDNRCASKNLYLGVFTRWPISQMRDTHLKIT